MGTINKIGALLNWRWATYCSFGCFGPTRSSYMHVSSVLIEQIRCPVEHFAAAPQDDPPLLVHDVLEQAGT
jgi:hypothetical protein